MDLKGGVVQKTVRMKVETWLKVVDVAQSLHFESENELFDYIIRVGAESLNGNESVSHRVIDDSQNQKSESVTHNKKSESVTHNKKSESVTHNKKDASESQWDNLKL